MILTVASLLGGDRTVHGTAIKQMEVEIYTETPHVCLTVNIILSVSGNSLRITEFKAELAEMEKKGNLYNGNINRVI